jgi:hypothetical protein
MYAEFRLGGGAKTPQGVRRYSSFRSCERAAHERRLAIRLAPELTGNSGQPFIELSKNYRRVVHLTDGGRSIAEELLYSTSRGPISTKIFGHRVAQNSGLDTAARGSDCEAKREERATPSSSDECRYDDGDRRQATENAHCADFICSRRCVARSRCVLAAVNTGHALMSAPGSDATSASCRGKPLGAKR